MNIIIKGKKGTYRITSDDRQFVISEQKVVQKDSKVSKKGDKYWVEIAYLVDLQNVINRLIDLELKRSDVESLKELLELYKETKNWIEKEIN